MTPGSVPAVRLARAVLLQALTDITAVSGTSFKVAAKRERRADALEWVWSDSPDAYSFLWICAELELDAGRLRWEIDTRPTRIKRLLVALGPARSRYGLTSARL